MAQTGAAFTTEASKWTTVLPEASAIAPYTTNCAGTDLLGGYNILRNGVGFHALAYQNLPAHNIVYFKMELFMIDSWEPVDYINIVFDATTMPFPRIGDNVGTWPPSICGHPFYPDFGPMYVFGKVVHNSSILLIRFYSKTDETPDLESFGVRNVQFRVANNSGGEVNEICAWSPTIANNNLGC